MKKKLAVVAVSWAILATGAAQAAPNTPYFSASVGMSRPSDATLSDSTGSIDAGFDTGPMLAAAMGYNFGATRAELEFGYRTNSIDSFSVFGVSVAGSGDVTSTSLMANLYYDINPKGQWSPFIGIGAGSAQLEVEDVAIAGVVLGDADDTVFAWQLMAGVACKLADTAILDLSYRYFATADPDFDGIKAEYGGHSLMAGIRIPFWLPF